MQAELQAQQLADQLRQDSRFPGWERRFQKAATVLDVLIQEMQAAGYVDANLYFAGSTPDAMRILAPKDERPAVKPIREIGVLRRPDKRKWKLAIEDEMRRLGGTPQAQEANLWVLSTEKGTACVTIQDNGDNPQLGPCILCSFSEGSGTSKQDLHIVRTTTPFDAIWRAQQHLRQIRCGVRRQ